MKFAIVILARKNSKSIKFKNRFKLCGKPMVEYSLREANKTKTKLKFIVSDDKKIVKISKKYGFNTDYERPPHTSKDNSSNVETLLHFAKYTKNKFTFDYLVILQPTSPLRNSVDINKAINLVKKYKCNSLCSISESLEHPYEAIKIKKKKWDYILKKSKKFYRRQDFDINSFFINGAIYIVSKNYLLKEKKVISNNHKFYLMPKSRSLDINDLEDMKIAEQLIYAQKNKN